VVAQIIYSQRKGSGTTLGSEINGAEHTHVGKVEEELAQRGGENKPLSHPSSWGAIRTGEGFNSAGSLRYLIK